MRTTSTLIALALLLITTTARAADADVAPPWPVETWIARLQALAVKHKGSTTIQKQAGFRAFVKAVRADRIEIISTIDDVTWEDGVATILTKDANDTRLLYTTEDAPLSLQRNTRFHLRMTEAQALAINKGDKLRITGTATLTPRSRNANPDGELLFNLTFQDLQAHGDFTARDAVYVINDKRYTPYVPEKPAADAKPPEPTPEINGTKYSPPVREKKEMAGGTGAAEPATKANEKKSEPGWPDEDVPMDADRPKNCYGNPTT